MSYGQIADSLGIPLGTVKSRLHAAVAAFAERWRTTQARSAERDGAAPKNQTKETRR
jgi:DNA-directed RNA polymerase specialized sigma24 family protein